jgi:hypothetical protein
VFQKPDWYSLLCLALLFLYQETGSAAVAELLEHLNKRKKAQNAKNCDAEMATILSKGQPGPFSLLLRMPWGKRREKKQRQGRRTDRQRSEIVRLNG